MNRTEIPRDNNARWEWIKYQLRTRGSSLAEVARSLNVSSPAVKNAKLTPYPRVERAIAAVLNLSPPSAVAGALARRRESEAAAAESFGDLAGICQTYARC
ncbi:helix-turn-helix domain-containing protein [Pseudomonas aeruginosa]|uniref:helix-turn-helix domain-containing protein n=1 Tax=Pseudomonas aeruginosa TaxID=287 RepID=UPI0020120E0E|nr:helix-turn-helix domain-containing protein [Pseudomonas aeruginosa]